MMSWWQSTPCTGSAWREPRNFSATSFSRSGQVAFFLLMEPAGAEPPFAPGFDAWQKEQPSQHKYEDWRRFWSRVNALLGYDYGFLGDPDDQNRIGDGLSAMQWVGLLTDALSLSISC